MRFFITIIILLSAGLSFAQDDYKKKISLGIRAGSTLSRVRFYPRIVTNFFPGITGGVAIKIMAERHVGIQAEVNYSQKGWNETVGIPENKEVSYSRRLNYIDVPFLTHVSLRKKRFGFICNLGPSLSYLISESEKLKPPTVQISDIAGDRKYYGKPVDFKLDLQFTGGLGLRYDFKNGSSFEWETRVYGSLSNIFKRKLYGSTASQNQFATTTLTYFLQLNKR